MQSGHLTGAREGGGPGRRTSGDSSLGPHAEVTAAATTGTRGLHVSVHSGPGRPASRHSHAGRVATHGARHLLGTPPRRPHSHARSRQPEPRPAPRLAPQTQTPSEALGGPRGEPVWRGLRSSPRHSGGPSRDRRSVTDGGLQGNYPTRSFAFSPQHRRCWWLAGAPRFGKPSQELCWALSMNISAARCLAGGYPWTGHPLR